MHHILILGDGDFSFSLSFFKGLQKFVDSMQKDDLNEEEKKSYHITATCFDSRQEVLSKYPSSASKVLKMIEQQEQQTKQLQSPSIQLLFNVNATGQLSSTGGPYQDIIFNFPHLGEEDANQHKRLLCHIFHSCNQVLDERYDLFSFYQYRRPFILSLYFFFFLILQRLYPHLPR